MVENSRIESRVRGFAGKLFIAAVCSGSLNRGKSWSSILCCRLTTGCFAAWRNTVDSISGWAAKTLSEPTTAWS